MKRTIQAVSTHTHKNSRSSFSRRALALTGLVCLAALAFLAAWRSASAQSGFNISTVAGSSGGSGPFADFQNARGVAIKSANEIYIADTDNHVIRKLDIAANTLTVFAGQVGQAAGNSTSANGDGGAATDALLNTPSDVAVDASGDVYISDSGNFRIRKITVSNGQINTIAGNGLPGASTGAALGSVVTDPRGIALDDTRLLIADAGSHRLIAINDLSGAPTVTHIAGNGAPGNEGDNGQANVAALNSPNDVAVDGATIYIADTGNHTIRVIAGGIINTFAGNGQIGSPTESGVATAVQLNSPTGVAVGAAHRIFISDSGNHRVRQVDGTALTTIAGRAGQGYNGDGTPATLYTLNAPAGIGVAGSDVFFLDAGNGRLRKVSGTTLSTIASDGSSGFAGDTGLASIAKLNGPAGVALDAAGNYYIADTNNHVIRKANASDGKINTIAGTPNTPSAAPGDPNGDGGSALLATFNRPSAVAVDANGNIFVADTGNNRVRKIDTNGNISTLAGLSSPLLNGPSSVAVFGSTLYIADPGNHVVRQVPTAGGTVTILAGTQGTLGFTGDNGSATAARLNRPSGIAVNSIGDVFIADTNNHRIRRVSSGAIGTVVTQGIPRSGFEGDGGSATTARLNSPTAVAVDSGGNLYILDKGNNRIRRVVAATNIINTVIGNGEIGFSGDGGPATFAKLSLASAIAVNASGVYVADTGNNRIRRAVAPPNTAPSLTSPGNKTVNEGSNLGFTLQATDSNATQTLTYSMTGAPSGATLNATTGVFSYTPSHDVVANNAGATQVFNVTFTATDDATPPLNDSKQITITVNNVNRAPSPDAGTIASPIEATGPAGAVVQLNGTANDPDGDSLTSVIWTDTISGATTTIASQLTAQVQLALGLHSIVLTVSDGKPNGTTSTVAKSVTVQDTTPPVFSNIPADITQNISSGTGAPVTFTLPTAMDVVSGVRTVTAAPASGSTFPIGTTTVTFSASDAAGNQATTTFKVTVTCNSGCNPPPPPPPPTGMNFNIEAFAGNGNFGSTGNGAAATATTFKQPSGIAADASGAVYIADAEARVIRKVSGVTISLLAGTGAKGFAGDSGAATSAKFNNPNGLAFHAASNSLYVADTGNHRIRKIDLTNNTISTIAGTGIAALGGNGPAASAWINSPMGVAVDAAGNVYFTDTGNNRVCKVSGGTLTVVAGTGEVGNSGDGASATAAKLNHPTGVAVSSDGSTLYIADRNNNRVRKVSGGTITNFAGMSNGTSGFGGDGAAATSAQLNAPTGVALDSGGNVIIADSDNERIRKVTTSDGVIVTIAGSGNAGNTGDSAAATSATLDTPTAVTLDNAGNIVFCDSGNLRARRLVMSGPTNNLPVPAQLANQSLNKSQQLNVALSATDADNDPVTFTLVPSLPFVSVINANAAARTATLLVNPAGGNVGVYNVQIKAEDNKGGSNLTPVFTITVSDPNGPPQNRPPVAVANQLPASIQAVGQTATVNLDGTGSSDPDNDPLTYSWADNGQVIATTAQASVQLAVGAHSIVLTVNDGKGGTASTAAQSVTVTAAPSGVLTIGTLTPNSGKRGTTVTVTISGDGFIPGQSVVTVNGGAVTVTPISMTATSVVAKFIIAGSAQTTTRNLTVTNPGGVSVTKSGAFTIQP
ncbi:MAG: SMP-30/gluconolactonase/LRE family protein [Blastocatellia bacterium]